MSMSSGQSVHFRTGVGDDAISGRGTLLGFSMKPDPNTDQLVPVAIVADADGHLDYVWVTWVKLAKG